MVFGPRYVGAHSTSPKVDAIRVCVAGPQFECDRVCQMLERMPESGASCGMVASLIQRFSHRDRLRLYQRCRAKFASVPKRETGCDSILPHLPVRLMSNKTRENGL